MKNQIEELTIDLLETEEIEKMQRADKLPFPALTIGTVVYFNRQAAPYVPSKIKWLVSGEYAICLPAKATEENAYAVRTGNKGSGKLAVYPAAARSGRLLKPGSYKLLKYKDGVAFKRYEPVEVGA